jgi:signal transduction histidine kinase
VRPAAILFVLLFAVAGLAASSVAWISATGAASGAGVADPGALIAGFEAASRPVADVDVAALYAGRLELLDPRPALPTWHEHARDEAVRVHAALARCPPPPLADLADASLAKAYAWHAATCQGGAPPEDAIERPPFMHPSGRSYAALALARGADPAEAARRHARAFHVLELAALDPAALTPEERALGALPRRAWEALARGDRLILTTGALVLAAYGPLGLAGVRVYRRADWEAFSRRAAVALAPRRSSAVCAQPASPDLCWEPVPAARRHRSILTAGTAGSAALATIASIALGIAVVRERRRAHTDRIHVLRTLTHELRTPATSLRIDIEPLRAAYDDLPAACQEPLLRISDGIERLHRVLHRSARYLALFETPEAPRGRIVKARPVPSARQLFEDLAEEWPEGVSLVAASEDAPVHTDPEWLGVAIRNLVENGARHGAPPLAVTWAVKDGMLVVRVTDGGSTPGLSIRRAAAPFERADGSAGLGLGLAIVDRVARLLGGRLSHEPSPTAFELRLPVGGPP